jgi:uncharacterized protein with ATP-grasp and redox domains
MRLNIADPSIITDHLNIYTKVQSLLNEDNQNCDKEELKRFLSMDFSTYSTPSLKEFVETHIKNTNPYVKYLAILYNELIDETVDSKTGRAMQLPDIGPMQFTYLVKKLSPNQYLEFDPFSRIKDRSNRQAKKAIDNLRNIEKKNKLEELIGSDQLNFRTCMALSIAGNVLDFTRYSEEELNVLQKNYYQITKEILSKDFDIDHTKQLKKALSKAEVFIFMPDNAGELYYDLPLLEYIKTNFDVKTHVSGKRYAHSNDVTIHDLRQEKLFNSNSIISTNTNTANLPKNSEAWKVIVPQRTVVLGKGMLHLEAAMADYEDWPHLKEPRLYNEKYELFTATRVKSERVANVFKIAGIYDNIRKDSNLIIHFNQLWKKLKE